MKLEIDLLREVLLFVEEKAARPLNEIEQVSIPGYEDAAVAYHIILAEEAGLLVAQIDTLPDTDDDAVLHVGYSIQRLTLKGHELIGAVRDETAWRHVKEGVRKIGSVTVSAVTGVAEAYLKQKISQVTGITIP
ncbi:MULTISPECIES: DUF2513 domain-containing protein [Rhizobium/Agrobacterium group]|nr:MULTISPECIES: DUF2513 domain-containing protein [Rhizobium/Agrobacterium group]NSZ52434.1 DUF2513 domain-containing protein [Agrobacterium vitis]NTA31196.1 DUF2513 domain-containing protein [Agrobacterium vitis]